MPSTTSFAAALALSITLSASTAAGDLITFTFAGHITRLEGDVDFLGGSIPVGAPFSGIYTFESTTPDSLPSDPTRGRYVNTITSFVVHIGPHSLSPNGVDNDISVLDDFDSYEDGYKLQERTTQILGRDVWVTMLLTDTSMTAFETDSLVTVPPDLTTFDENVFLLAISPVTFSIAGEIESIVPEPNSLVFSVLASFVWVIRRTHE